MDLCKYKNSLGVPGAGAHKRLFGVAVFDVIATLFLSVCTAKLCNISVKTSILLWMTIGVVMHMVFCVDTNFTLWLKSLSKE